MEGDREANTESERAKSSKAKQTWRDSESVRSERRKQRGQREQTLSECISRSCEATSPMPVVDSAHRSRIASLIVSLWMMRRRLRIRS